MSLHLTTRTRYIPPGAQPLIHLDANISRTAGPVGRLVTATGIGYVASLPSVDPVAVRFCRVPDLRWAGPGETCPIDVYERRQEALNARDAPGPLKVATVAIRCTVLAIFDDDDLRPFGATFESFERRTSIVSQEVMRWVRARWGVDGIVTRSRENAEAKHLALTVEALSTIRTLDTQEGRRSRNTQEGRRSRR